VTGIRAMPVLGVADMPRALAFYREALGFELAGAWPSMEQSGGAPGFAILSLGTITVALDAHNEPPKPRTAMAAYLYLDDIDGYHRALTERGVAVERCPEDAPYGCRDMDLRDPDGHLLCFGQDLNPGPNGPGL